MFSGLIETCFDDVRAQDLECLGSETTGCPKQPSVNSSVVWLVSHNSCAIASSSCHMVYASHTRPPAQWS